MNYEHDETPRGRGRPRKVANTEEEKLKQAKSHQYYLNFKEKHKDKPPIYHKKPNAKLGRPKKIKDE
jgi:hypothetical protein